MDKFKEAMDKCSDRLEQNSRIADEAYYNNRLGLCKIKENENEWLSKVYELALLGYSIRQSLEGNGAKW